MTLVEQLADIALSPTDDATVSHLRMLTATNVAAGLGTLGAAGALVEALPFDTSQSANAAYAEAMRLHARTQDDFHPGGRVHVGAVTLAVAVALAESVTTRLLDCLAAGYKVMCAVATVYSADAQKRGYRPTGFFGPLGAAATAAVALGLDRDGIANAIGLAAASSKGTNQSWLSGTDEWLLEVGSAARAGVEAAQLTAAGLTSSSEAIEGGAGWARAFFDDAGASRLESALAEPRSQIIEVAVKPYPVSGIAQVATALGCSAHARLEGAVPDAIRVRLSTAEAAYPGSTNRGPFRSRSAALMSVAFCVACGLADGTVRLARLEEPNADDLRTLIGNVTLAPDDAVAESEAIIELGLNGSTMRLEGKGSTLLYPSWHELAADSAGLAVRSEADEQDVAAALSVLTADDADARDLAAIGRRAS